MNNQNHNDLPIIDWELGIRLAGNNRAVAEELMSLLVKRLPADFLEICQAREVKNYIELLRLVHKLHGGLCYCGTPRLKNAAAAVEVALKHKKYVELPELFKQLEVEVSAVVNYGI